MQGKVVNLLKRLKTLVKLELKFELRTTEFRIPLVRTYE
jgi:hypothetical protein